MKTYLLIILCAITFSTQAQTNVSGGIYANGVWTKANSPYIVTGTVVVFPGVTLTIEAGVIVKFYDGTYLEIRQGTLIALGNNTDSITFTSNSVSPYRGIWDGIIFNDPVGLQTDYCVYKYASNALNFGTINFNVTIQHSSFYNNTNCIPKNYSPTIVRLSTFYNNALGLGDVTGGCTIDSCIFINNIFGAQVGSQNIVINDIFINNETGLSLQPGSPFNGYLIKQCVFCNNKEGCNNGSEGIDSMINCNFSENHIGLTTALCHYMTGNIFADNDTGIFARYSMDSTFTTFGNYIYHNQVGLIFNGGDARNFINNKICNNTLYNLKYSSPSNGVASNNCWCDTDSARIESKIYDGYTNVSLGLIKFTPFVSCDSSVIAAVPPINCSPFVLTQIKEYSNHSTTETFKIFPNPATTYLTITTNTNTPAEIIIYDIASRKLMEKKFIKEVSLNIEHLAKGVYLYQVTDERGMVSRGKVVKE